jgi:hypothetical protein
VTWFLATFPAAFWWGVLTHATVAVAAFAVGYFVSGWHMSATPPDPRLAMERSAADEAYGWNRAVRVAEATLAQVPTSIGGRAIVRALGGTVPAINRKRGGTDADGAA